MCGIVGYLGSRQAAPILLDGLTKLEYRGYDSAGVCVMSDGILKVAKSKGRLANLSGLIDGGNAIRGTYGIGHTRWATHGAPSDINSHPHIADAGKIAVVHNGIIENYLKLKEDLIRKGKHFQSETDTEVVANLVEYYYDRLQDFPRAVRRAVGQLEGSYALGILCQDFPGTMIAVKKESPLIFGFGEGENFIASDVPAILKYTRKVVYLNDGDTVIFTKDNVRFYDAFYDPVEKVPEVIDWDISAAEKCGYDHFMIKEIHEQPKAVKGTLSPRIRDGRVVLDDIKLTKDYLEELKRIYIVACGSSYYVGCLGKHIIEKTCRIPVEPILASEFRYSEPVLGKDTLVLIISQSGETADTKAALEEAKRQGARTLAIVNVVGSAIAKAADDVIYTWAGPEIAVATTKAFSTQLSVIYLIALYIADLLKTIKPEEYNAIVDEMVKLDQKISLCLTPDSIARIRYYAEQHFKVHDAFFIGRNVDSAICLEGSLKLKEIAYIHSEAYAAGELKHGPISLIEDGTLVVAVATVDALFDKTMSNVKEVRARGADVFAVTTEKYADEIKKTVPSVITVPVTHPLLQPSLTIIPLQVFAYYIALLRDCDVDKPRNLAKSVTVE
ncbi:MAG: glutamine--fructose-6-phosphate transaminase (isomerizing) [Oscillospiraceae bacterium]|nr:glutamine--fructose-6-phosphate transaminase (isomerizing) [Oscillospiraceae bacterium]MBR4194364.1 glutamine--fructose-6-phosphate transaminase (isomerizing) [Oscillospiraceae bacterium]